MKPFLFLLCLPAFAEQVALPGLRQPVEILRDKWGIPHIYAQTTEDLFFAQGYMAARDRLFQLDLWRRINSGHLAEVQGPAAMPRDRIARLVRYRGDAKAEWDAYSPDARAITEAFVRGINARIDSLKANYGLEFKLAGYAPAKWVAEDCIARIAGLLMVRNLPREVERAMDIREYGAAMMEMVKPPDPFVKLRVPPGLDLSLFHEGILKDHAAAIGSTRIDVDQGSNNWVVDGTRSATGKPLLANDPHRPIHIPSLRKSVHLVGPGWNAIGSGEPALPGIALGHNEEIAFGFTIVGIDQADLFVERTNPANAKQYWHKGAWKNMEVERQSIKVKGRAAENVELLYTVHGPVLYEDRGKQRAYALKWAGAEPGGAGYLGALALSRAKNWADFRKAAGGYKVPSENLVYADRAGNIGWIASGLAPIRKNYDGLLPVPGDSGDYEWSGFLSIDQHPQEYNPPRHWIATANSNILPEGYKHRLSHEWAMPFRAHRVAEMLTGTKKLSIEDMQRMQQDVNSLAARRFIEVLKKKSGAGAPWADMLKWDGTMSTDRIEPTIYAVWTSRLPQFLLDSPAASRMELTTALKMLEAAKDDKALRGSYDRAIVELTRDMGADRKQWTWGRLHTVTFTHPLKAASGGNAKLLHRGPIARPGDGNTVNSTSGPNFKQSAGASYRQIIDVADWDRSVMTNVPGESGDPTSAFYSNLLEEWATGKYHPMLYSRKAIEAATAEKIQLVPAK